MRNWGWFDQNGGGYVTSTSDVSMGTGGTLMWVTRENQEDELVRCRKCNDYKREENRCGRRELKTSGYERLWRGA